MVDPLSIPADAARMTTGVALATVDKIVDVMTGATDKEENKMMLMAAPN